MKIALNYFFVAIGGALGAISRYFLQNIIQKLSNCSFPTGTLFVNVIGCFILGIIISYDNEHIISLSFKSFMIFGLLGGFTTFSAFGFETFSFLKDGQLLFASINILASVFLSIIGIWLGHIIGKFL